jgi:hypothetical protein
LSEVLNNPTLAHRCRSGAVHPNKIIAGCAVQTGKIEHFKPAAKPHYPGLSGFFTDDATG